jgi:hypothetical protein
LEPDPLQRHRRSGRRARERFSVLAVVLLQGLLDVVLLPPPARSTEQPIAFSHKVHADDYRVPCLFCHSNARRSSVAGIPSVQFCMGCHKITAADKPEVQKLKEYWDRREPIPWVKIFNQPHFVHFSHVAHVRVGIDCQTCHGPIQTMDQVRQTAALTMDRCVACHRERAASIDCATCHN